MKFTATNSSKIRRRRERCAGAGKRSDPDTHKDADATLERAQRPPRRRGSASASSHRSPVERRTHRYWRDSRIASGCVSERHELPEQEKGGTDFNEALEDALLAAGFDFPKAELATRIFEEIFAKFSNVRAADAVREILLKIADTKSGKSAEFRALLAIFSPSRTHEEIADEAGISRQSMAYHIEKLRPYFALPPA